jgi:hypothetical protein
MCGGAIRNIGNAAPSRLLLKEERPARIHDRVTAKEIFYVNPGKCIRCGIRQH